MISKDRTTFKSSDAEASRLAPAPRRDRSAGVARCLRDLRQSATRFRTDESGILEKPMIMTLLCMVAVGGIGIDIVHHERDRTNIQYTLDRAVLAAADLDQQEADPEIVVLDYMTKAGLGEYHTTVPDPVVLPTQRKVTAEVDAEFDPLWLKFANYDQALPLRARSKAEESIGKVEISLVLDVSGSMGSNSRLTNLKVAAKEFIETMDANTEEDNMSISIVPYSTQVSMPEEFMTHLNRSDEHDYSYCLNFDAADYNTTELSTSDTYEQTMHFSISNRRDYRTKSRHVERAVCASHDDNPERTSILFEDDVQTLKDYIDDFEATDNTSLDIGMKWGVALLDPSVQPIISDMATGEGAPIAEKFANRPVAYSDNETIKVVVLMTDGENTSQYYVNDGYRKGKSTVWYNTDANVYSTYDNNRSGTKKYYWHNTNTWVDHPYGNGSYTETYCTGTVYNGNCYYGSWKTRTVDEPGTAEELTYTDLFADTTLQYIFYDLFYDWMNYYDARDKWYYDVYNSVNASAKNNRTSAICEAAKDAGIIVFTIGFEAPRSGQSVLRDCASSDSHFYDVEGLEISDAFASIASAIRQLRLTE